MSDNLISLSKFTPGTRMLILRDMSAQEKKDRERGNEDQRSEAEDVPQEKIPRGPSGEPPFSGKILLVI